MQPAAQISATIECLGQLLNAWHEGERLPADRHFYYFTKPKRYIGSKDRQAIAAHYYHTLRYLAILDDLATNMPNYQAVLPFPCPTGNGEFSARGLMLASLVAFHGHTINEILELFDGKHHHPQPPNGGELVWLRGLYARFTKAPMDPNSDKWVTKNCPTWLFEAIKESVGERVVSELAALQDEAPVDIRTNTLKNNRDTLQKKLAADGIETEPTPTSPLGLRLKQRTPIFHTPSFREGGFEMQDEGSQIAAALVDAKAGMRVIDFCAGAGGKTLAIAAQMNNKGRVLALDTSAKRLKDLPIRLRRAGVDNVQWKTLSSERDSMLKRHKQTADRVLVDAPCSGSGTWRRNPDLKWRITPAEIDELQALQTSILASAAKLVKPGGRLIYATCSLLTKENQNVIEHFLQTHGDFRVVCAQKIWNKLSIDESSDVHAAYLSLSPGSDGTDGFFAAVLLRQPTLAGSSENPQKQ